MNDDERKVVAETARMERATGQCLHAIERRLEETTSIAHATCSSLKQNTSRLHKVQDTAENLMSSTKATHKLLNRLRRWGASDHVGRHHSIQKKQGGGTDTEDEVHSGGSDGDTAKVERLLYDLDVTKDFMREEVEDQRKSIKRLGLAADSVAGIAAAKRRGSASSSSSAPRISGTNKYTRSEEKYNKADDEATLDRIGDLLDRLQDHAIEYTVILDAQSKDLDKIDNTIDSAQRSMKRASQRLKKNR